MLTTLLSLYASGTLFGANLNFSLPAISANNGSISSSVSVVPTRNEQNMSPVMKAKSVIAVDLKTGTILYEKNSRDELPIASITKLMTEVIILENHNLNEVMTVSKKATQIEGSKIWLYPGEQLTVKNLLYAALIPSANDAAYTLAENDSGSVETFVEKMNQKAIELGLDDTNFTNPVGLDEEGNYSSAYDLSILASYAYSKPFINQSANLKEHEITSTDGKLKHVLKSTNELLSSYLKVLGLKTGTTDLAGQCLVAVIENDKGHDILTIVLGSPSRFQETKILADWIFRTYKWQ